MVGKANYNPTTSGFYAVIYFNSSAFSYALLLSLNFSFQLAHFSIYIFLAFLLRGRFSLQVILFSDNTSIERILVLFFYFPLAI